MQIISPQLVFGKRVLLRMDLDVPITNGQITDPARLLAGVTTLKMCLESAKEVIVMGHVGRPEGEDPSFSVKPIVDWFESYFKDYDLPEGKFHILENLRFEKGEEEGSLDFAKELENFGDIYINEAFASHHPSASTTVLPTLMPHAAGLQFAKEVETLLSVRQNPIKPLTVIIGGVKLEDKLPAVLQMAKVADAVLVGGKIAAAIKEENVEVPANVMVGKLNDEGTDLAPETIESWRNIILSSKMIVWNGPLGKINSEQLTVNNLGSAKSTYEIGKMITESGAKSIIGGGDSIAALKSLGLIEKFSFVSTGGGAMLKLLEKGTLPTIEALK